MRFISTRKHSKKEIEEMKNDNLFEELYASREEKEVVEEATPEPVKRVMKRKEGTLTKVGKTLDQATGKFLCRLGKRITKAGSNMVVDAETYMMKEDEIPLDEFVQRLTQ